MGTKVVVGSFTPSVLLAVARRTGRLGEHGIEVDEVPVSSSPEQFRALVDGALDAAFTSPDNVLAYRFSPANPLGAAVDVRIVAALDRGLGLALYGRPGLDRPEQLRGARVGVDVPVSGFALAMYALADSLGVGRDDYELAELGSTPRRLRALLAGECDATMLGAGNELLAEQAGCVPLARVADVCAPYLGAVLCVAGDAHRGAAVQLAYALRRTAEDVVAGRADEAARAAAVAALGLPEDLAVRYVERLGSPDEGLVLHDVSAEATRAALATVVGLRRRYLPGGTSGTGGTDELARALEPASGLIAAEAHHPPQGGRRIGQNLWVT